MLFLKKMNIILVLVSVTVLVLSIERVEKIKQPNSTFEIRLVFEFSREYFDIIRVVKFTNFKQIKWWSFNFSNYKCLSTRRLRLVFLPDRLIPLDRSLNVDLFRLLNQNMTINFIYVSGFDAKKFQLSLVDNYRSKFKIIFYLSYFNLLMNGRELSQKECNSNNFNHTNGYFKNIFQLHFNFGTRYSSQTCKFIFKNARLGQLFLYDLTSSFVKSNRLEFYPSSLLRLDSKITALWLQLYNYKLTKRLLDQNVFNTLNQIVIKGHIGQIDSDLFLNLRFIIYIKINVTNVRTIYSQGIEWIASLNNFLTVNLSNVSDIVDKLNNLAFIQTYSKLNDEKIEKVYSYPDEDFCWYANFPFENLVFVDPHTVCVNDNCSCTQYWLLKYAYFIKRSGEMFFYYKKYFNDEKPYKLVNYDNESIKCNFSQMIQKCKEYEGLSKPVKEYETRSTFFHALVISQYVDFVSVVLLPIIGAFGIVINIISIKVISTIDLTKTPEDKQQTTLVQFMLAYSITNLIYCLIHSVSFVAKCVDQNSIYCPQFYYTEFAQYYKIIVVEFCGAVLKSFSNVAYFCISLNRYILLEKEGKMADFIHQKVSKLKGKVKIFWIVFISLLLMGLNTHKLIIYQVISSTIFNLFYDVYPAFFFSLPIFVANSRFYEQNYNYNSVQVTNAKSIVYEVFTFVNFVLNDVILFFVFTLIDILLVVSFKRSTEKKKILIQTRFINKDVQKEKLTQLEQTVTNVLKIIIINTLFLVMVKSFDFAISISKFNIWKEGLVDMHLSAKLNGFCHLVKICAAYEELVKLAYMMYYCFTTVAFYYLNKNFRSNFGTLCGPKPKITIATLVISTVRINSNE